MKNLLLRDDDNPRSRKKTFDPTSFGMFSIVSYNQISVKFQILC